MPNKLNAFITRPKKQGLKLQQALAEVGVSSICQPLFEYQLNTSTASSKQQLSTFTPDILIFISSASVNFMHQALPLNQWVNKKTQVLAVGTATQKALALRDIESLCPENHTSEGLLDLPLLSEHALKENNQAKNILIIRGDGGREHLASQLTFRGASVQYIESYKRSWLDVPADTKYLLTQKKVNTIIITSNALLKRVVNLIDIHDKYWKNTCLWVVASERIAQMAQQLGLSNVLNSQGASDTCIVQSLLNMESTND